MQLLLSVLSGWGEFGNAFSMSFYLTEYLPVEVCSGIALHCQFLQSVLFSKRKSGIEFSIFKLCAHFSIL